MARSLPTAEQRRLLLELLIDRTLNVAEVRQQVGITRQGWNALLASDKEFRSAYHALRIRGRGEVPAAIAAGFPTFIREMDRPELWRGGFWFGGAPGASGTTRRQTEDTGW